MKVFRYSECKETPRADMFLPNWVNDLGFLLDAVAIGLFIVFFITKNPLILLLVVASAAFGIVASLCWKNQTIKILDEESFEYSTFLGKKNRYFFCDIRAVRRHRDSLTLYIGAGKVHIEYCAVISAELLVRIDQAIKDNRNRRVIL